MKLKKMFVIKIGIVMAAVSSLLISTLVVPSFIESITTSPNEQLIKVSYLIVLGISHLPLLYSFYLAIKLIDAINSNKEFSTNTINLVSKIRYNASMIFILYVAFILVMTLSGHFESIVFVISVIILFITVIFILFAFILEGILNKAFTVKSENDLTI